MVKKYLAYMLIYLFNLFPIKKNKIFLFSYYGSQYGCNPKYITNYIIKNYPKGSFDLVWAFNRLDGKEHLKNIRKVRVMSLKYFYELCTSKIIITNYRTTDLYVKRKNQYYIQTWHSSLRLKQIEKDAGDALPKEYIQMAQKDSIKCDLLLSGCKYSTDIFKRAFWYKGKILESGTPRNDMLFESNSSMRKKIMKQLKINENQKIVLYAPTFRKDGGLEVYSVDFSKVMKQLKMFFGGEWTFLVKLHPHLISKSKDLLLEDEVIDVTSYDDVQELLSIADVLITDYSSLMFDFAFTKRPCFLYVTDLNQYIAKERDLYFDIRKLPFKLAENNPQLLEQIRMFDEKEYNRKILEFSKQIGSFETGNASRKLLKHIEKVCFRESGRENNESKAI